MSKLEDQMFASNNTLLDHVVYWHRYVDDVVCLWSGSIDKLNGFLQFVKFLPLDPVYT